MDSGSHKPCALVVCEGSVGVVRFDLDGKRVWDYSMTPPITAAPAVGDINGDGTDEIVAADAKGNLVALTAEGKPVWTACVPKGVSADSCPAIVDLDGDNKAEILVGDTGGNLTCLDRDGKTLWQFAGDGTQMGPALVADIYDSPGKEIIVTSHDRHIYALTARGEWLWDLFRPDDLYPNSTPILADLDGDGVPELYVGGGLNHLFRIDLATHRITLEKNVYMHINGAIQASDLNGDGKDELVFCTKGGSVQCYGAEGLRWKRDFKSAGIIAAPGIAALGEDSALKILVYSTKGTVHALNSDGSDFFTAPLVGAPCAAPFIGDFHGTGMLELAVTSPGGMDGNAMMAFLKTSLRYRDNASNRTMFAQDRAHSGRASGAKAYALLKRPQPASAAGQAAASATALNEAALFSGLNTWRFDVVKPESTRLAFLAELTAPDGSVRRVVRHLRGEKERVAVSFNVTLSGGYRYHEALIDADNLTVTGVVDKKLDYAGLESDSAYLTKELFPKIASTAQAWAGANPDAASTALRQLSALRGTLLDFQQAKDNPDVAAIMELRTATERLRALIEAGQAMAPKGSFFAWPYNPWAYFDARDTLPDAKRRDNNLSATVCVGEYASLAVNVTNVFRRSLDIRVGCDTWVTPEPAVTTNLVSFRRAVSVPNTRRERVADALPELDQGGLLHVAAGETEQLWITVNGEGLKPGVYSGKIKLRSVEPDPTEVDVPIVVKVLALEMPRPRPLRFCLWAYDGSDLGTDKPVVLNDLVTHGDTVFFGVAPAAVCDATGALVNAPDFKAHDEAAKRLSPQGFLLYGSPQAKLTGQPFLSDPWKKAFVQYLRAWVAHMKELGMNYDQWALYPYDEPSGPFNETTLNLVEIAKVIREADPKILIYADPTSGTTMETVEMYKGLLDIWCPSAELLERLGPELIPAAKQYGKEVWFYDASGEAKTLSCLGLYRWRFWYAWNQGFTGVGWWVYALHGDASRWDGPNSTGDFFTTVYEGPKGPVASKRWEVAREGIQDYERLFLFRKAIEDREKAGDNGPAVAAAKKVLNETPKAMEKELLNTGRRLPLNPDSVPLYEDISRKLEEARASVAEQCLALKGGTK